MRYQLPAGVSAISVAGVQFDGDAKGVIDVKDDGIGHIHAILQHPALWNLPIAEDEPAPTEPTVDVAADQRDERRRIINELSSYGVREDGRSSLAYLRGRLGEVRARRAGEAAPEPEPEAAPAEGQPPVAAEPSA